MKTNLYLSLGITCTLLVLTMSRQALPKSVFAIASHGGSEVKAYSIDPNSAITWQATVDQTESFGNGAGALCLWPSKDRIFITYEDGDGVIAWASIKILVVIRKLTNITPVLGN